MKVMPDELKALARYIYGASGISLDDSKAYLIEGRLSGLAAELKCGTFGELYFKARSDTTGALQRRVIDAITTGETLFFRDVAPFELLRHKLLPELIDRRRLRAGPRGTVPIRIWSAACSTGQEVYSIGIVLHETLGDLDRYAIQLVGTDIADRAVAAASRGIYNKIEMERGLAGSASARYFSPSEGGWKIRDDVRALATFKRLNLMEDFSSLGRFDLVFCRNVAIYFNEADRKTLFTRIGRAMEPDGALVIGSTESLTGLCPQFDSQRHLRSVFYRLKPA